MGGNRVGVELGLQMAEGFEAPTHDHAVVYNDGDDGQLIQRCTPHLFDLLARLLQHKL